VLPARPGFTKDGRTDATEYMLAVFDPTHDDMPEATWLDNRDVQNRWPKVDDDQQTLAEAAQ
jgi:hypothetical protein